MLLGSALFTGWTGLVVWSDCRNRRVANWLVAAGGAAAIVCAGLHASPFGVGIVPAAVGFVVGFAVLLPFFLLGVMGAADVKVFAVLGAWCGATALLGLWVVASIGAALHALVLVMAAKVPSENEPAWSPWRGGQATFSIGARRATPYAALLAGAAALHWLGGLVHGAMR